MYDVDVGTEYFYHMFMLLCLLYVSGFWAALRELYPGTEIKGCVFHWVQAVYRHVGEIGLIPSYKEQGLTYR